MSRFRTKALIAALAVTLTTSAQAGAAATMTKAQYINLWTKACVVNGRTKSLKLTTYESLTMSVMVDSFLRGYHSTLAELNMPVKSLSAMKREACGCMAAYIASRKSNLTASNPDRLIDRAVDRCLLK